MGSNPKQKKEPISTLAPLSMKKHPKSMISGVFLVAEVGFERPTKLVGTGVLDCPFLSRPYSPFACRMLSPALARLGILALCGVNRCEKDTQSFSLRLQVIRPTSLREVGL